MLVKLSCHEDMASIDISRDSHSRACVQYAADGLVGNQTEAEMSQGINRKGSDAGW